MDEKKKKRIKKAAAIATLSTSVFLANVIDSPDELINGQKVKPKNYAQIEIIEDDEPSDNQGNNLKSGLKKMILDLPAPLRIVAGIPLWFLGTGLSSLLSLLFKGIVTPIMEVILHFILRTLIMLAVIVLAVKILFPDLELKKILNKKTLIIVIIFNIILSICDLLVPKFWPKYTTYRNIMKFISSTVVIVLILRPFIKLYNKLRYEPEIIVPEI